MITRIGSWEVNEGCVSTIVSMLEVERCESDVLRPSMIGVNASPVVGSSGRTAICWASKTAGGVRTPECEKMAGTALEYRRKGGLPGPATKEDDACRPGGMGICNVEGRRGDPPSWGPNAIEGRLCSEVRRGFDANLPEIRPGRVGVGGRSPSISGASLSESRASPSNSISESVSNGSSLSAFIAAATQRSAMFVTAFSFAINSLCAKLRSPVSTTDCGPSALEPLRRRIELAVLPRLAAALANRCL
jgi:hypothetical protein